ncbi:hypothetical protein GCM10025787_29780 [Saccharopolyspora rosea]
MPLSADAAVPDTWECPHHSTRARAAEVDNPTPARRKRPRTHWDMLLERRSIPDLERLLNERLALLKARRQPPPNT